MRKVENNDIGTSKLLDNKLFNVCNFLDVEILESLKYKLKCSTATLYRTLEAAGIPIYYIGHKTMQTVLHSATLYRVAKTPAWKKYLKKIKYVRHDIQSTESISMDEIAIPMAVGSGLLDLTLEQAISAADLGLIPSHDYNLASWFVYFLQGKLIFPLPMK